MSRLVGISLFSLIFLLGVLPAQAIEPPLGILKITPRPAPDLQLTNTDEQPFDLKKARGHWVFVHFWASWCGPCRREMPSIQKLTRLFDPKKLQIVLINTAEDEDTIFSFLGAVSPDLPSLMDKNGLVTENWSPRGLPATYLVDPDGIIRYQALGGRPWEKTIYRQFLEQIINHPDEKNIK